MPDLLASLESRWDCGMMKDFAVTVSLENSQFFPVSYWVLTFTLL